MSKELVPVDEATLERQGDRMAALEQLNAAAEAAATPEEAREIMVKARTISDFLRKMKAPLEETRFAGRTSVVAGRKLGLMLVCLSPHPTKRLGRHSGTSPSDRGRVRAELGINVNTCAHLVRLARVPDPDFQRYIQDPTLIPSVSGAFRALTGQCPVPGLGYAERRRRRAGVKIPRRPLLDQAHKEIRLALGHLEGIQQMPGGGPKRRAAIGDAMRFLYAASDAIRPYTSGYGREH